ncbi:NAD(P)/FAD-dependent oxidoreductase [Trichormus variabilis]|uniref:NADH dehydrogenase n=1 Tax=Trichormus variabilis SAG 1403-4b TaxID=447716 RepID=A0A433UR65_ANAVA|nr:NAD(P)/FAD-dependent oxidoreductase [Trichormus variabilis]MBD2628439.1 NAD(P)/FAD-dependent oxidoreductase [Trichormus variabilis FACHB-164]RUS96322.1 NADH dehydrogenase [Trichormus variabilis SAG 1403-4b]
MYQVDDKFRNQGKFKQRPVINTHPVRICILGGGFGGLYTALELGNFAKCPYKYEIKLIERRDNFLFTPLLYEVVTGELHNWEVAPSYNKLLADSSAKFCQGEVKDVDLEENLVTLQNGEILTYDYLVLAVGKETRLDIVPGAAEYAQTFRTLEDAEYLKERLRFLEASDLPVIKIVIAGAGPNGVEIACKLADRLGKRGEIRLIDRGNEILTTFSKGSQTASYRALVKRGVQIDLNTNIEAIKSDVIIINHQGKTQHLQTNLVLWTGGNQSIPWVKNLNCQHNQQGQLVATSTLQLAGYPNVFVLGDLAEIRDAQGNETPATAQAAFQQAPCAARNIWAKMTGRKLKSFSYLHLGEMLTLGIKNAVVYSFGITLDGNLARIIRRGVYIQRLPTLKHKLQVAKRWIVGGIKKLLRR